MLSGEVHRPGRRCARLGWYRVGQKNAPTKGMRREQADLRRLRYYGHGGRSGYERMLADARRYPGRVREGLRRYLECPHGPRD